MFRFARLKNTNTISKHNDNAALGPMSIHHTCPVKPSLSSPAPLSTCVSLKRSEHSERNLYYSCCSVMFLFLYKLAWGPTQGLSGTNWNSHCCQDMPAPISINNLQPHQKKRCKLYITTVLKIPPCINHTSHHWTNSVFWMMEPYCEIPQKNRFAHKWKSSSVATRLSYTRSWLCINMPLEYRGWRCIFHLQPSSRAVPPQFCLYNQAIVKRAGKPFLLHCTTGTYTQREFKQR